jgi:hypothetical protein
MSVKIFKEIPVKIEEFFQDKEKSEIQHFV